MPTKRIDRKCQQLENFFHVFKKHIHKKNSNQIIVDFCSGGGHLGLFLAYMFPDCTVKLVENKEESLNFAIKRINQLNLKNCIVYKVKTN